MNSLIAQRILRNTPARKRIHAVLAAVALCLPACSALSQTTASVTVNATSVSAAVPPEGYGVDTAVYDGGLTASGVAPALQAAGVTALRYPGGSYADVFNFISGTDQTLNDGAYLAPNTSFNLWMSDTVLPAGAAPVITVNYGSNVTDDGPALPSEAASWVQYANVTNNYGIVYWEIGNETYGNGYYSGWDWEYDLHDLDQTAANRVGNAALSPTAYGTNAAAFVLAMKAVDPSIKCGISVNTSQYSPGWDKDVFQAISSALSGTGLYPDFVIVHWYPNGTDAQALAAQATIPALVAQIRSDLEAYYTLSNVNEMQILVTESGPPNTGGIVPFLFAADEFPTWFENGASNVDYQALHQGFLEPTSNEQDGPSYGTLFSSTVARVGYSMVAATSSNSLLRTHAVQRTDGQTGVILVNEDPTNNAAVTVSISGVTLSSTGTQYNFGNANFSSGSATANSGISESSLSGVGNNFTVTVPAYSATAILMPALSGKYFLLSNSGNLNLVAGATTGNTSTITVSPSNGFTGTVGLTCAVSGPSGATSPATCSLATPSVASGSTDALTVTTVSTTTAGSYTITVTGTSGSITQTTTVTVIVTAPPVPSFALTNGGAITISPPGATTGNTTTITVTPSGGFTGSVALTAAIATSPSGATDLPTFSFSATPVSITAAGAGTSTLTISTTAATSTQCNAASQMPHGIPWYAGGGAVLAGIFLFGIPSRRRKGRAILGMLVLLAVFTGGVLACGGGSSAACTPTTTPGTTAGSYTITVTGTSGALTGTSTVTLTVQ